MEQDNIDIIINHIKNKHEHFTIDSQQSFDKLLREAINQDPRILVYYLSFKSHHQNITMTYRQDAPIINDIIIDDGYYTLMNDTTTYPQKIYIVTQKYKKVLKRIKKSFDDFYTKHEGLYAYQVIKSSFGIYTKYVVLTIEFDYCMPLDQLDEKNHQADLKAKQIADELTCNQTIPSAVKAFLVLSYLQQNTIYAHDAFDEILTNPHAIKDNPYPHISYGPLLVNKGICSGLSHAFKRIMYYMDEECYVMSGKIRQIVSVEHAWNLIKIEDQYYHIDVTYDTNQKVCVKGFLKDDKHIKGHKWHKESYPQAKGITYNYEYVRNWLDEHSQELIEAGIEEKYIFPQMIE